MCACVKADADIVRRCRLGARQKFGLSYVVHRALDGSHYLANLIKTDFKAIRSQLIEKRQNAFSARGGEGGVRIYIFHHGMSFAVRTYMLK